MFGKVLFIVNPKAGRFSTSLINSKLDKYKKISSEVDIYYTSKTDTKNKITKAVEAFVPQLIIVGGGDGTLFNIVNSVNFNLYQFHLLPIGSGNDVYQQLVYSQNTNNKIAVHNCNGHFFINGIGIGIDSVIAESIQENNSKLPARLKYWRAIAKHLFTYKGCNIEISIGGKKTVGKFLIVALMNGKQYGNGFKIAPNAELQEPALQCVQVGFITAIKRLIYLPKIKKGKHHTLSFVNIEPVSMVCTINSSEPLLAQLDGELIKNNSFKIKYSGQINLRPVF